MQSLTPRERQVQRFVEAAHLFDLDIAGIEAAATIPAGSEVVMSQSYDKDGNVIVAFDPALPPAEQVAAAAIDAFIAEIVEVQPWTGLADLTPRQIAAARRLALRHVAKR